MIFWSTALRGQNCSSAEKSSLLPLGIANVVGPLSDKTPFNLNESIYGWTQEYEPVSYWSPFCW